MTVGWNEELRALGQRLGRFADTAMGWSEREALRAVAPAIDDLLARLHSAEIAAGEAETLADIVENAPCVDEDHHDLLARLVAAEAECDEWKAIATSYRSGPALVDADRAYDEAIAQRDQP